MFLVALLDYYMSLLNYTTIFDYPQKMKVIEKKTDTDCLFFRNPLTLILTVIGKFLAPIFLVVYI